MESSEVPKIMRQYLYLRNFTSWIRHVAGKMNTADYWSRLLSFTVPEKLNKLYFASYKVGEGSGSGLEFEQFLGSLLQLEDDNMDFWNDFAWLKSTLKEF